MQCSACMSQIFVATYYETRDVSTNRYYAATSSIVGTMLPVVVDRCADSTYELCQNTLLVSPLTQVPTE